MDLGTMARALLVLGLPLGFGTLVLVVAVAGPALQRAASGGVGQALADPASAGLAAMAQLGLGLGAAGWLVWLLVQAGGGQVGPGAVAAVGTLISATLFGRVAAFGAVACVAAMLALRGRPDGGFWYVSLGLAGSAVAAQALLLHGYAMDGPGPLLASEIVHLLAASAWLGALPGLLFLTVALPATAAEAVLRRFSPPGFACVVAVLVTAAVQSDRLLGGLPGLVGTPYGWLVGTKALLLASLVAMAAANRQVFVPALRTGAGRRALVASLAVETGFGLAALGAAVALTGLPPAIHVQPDWPFAWRPSLDAWAEPELRAEILAACVILGFGVLLAAAAVWARCLAPGAIGTACVALALPHLALLLVPAGPTAYYRSPTGFAATSIMQGAALYPSACADCHGAAGRGDGRLAGGLPVPPADLTAAHLWDHPDGELFGWIAFGMVAPGGAVAMVGFAGTLSEDEIWALIDYIRARNAGLALRDEGVWPVAVAGPDLDLACPDGRLRNLPDLAGRPVQVTLSADGGVEVASVAGDGSLGISCRTPALEAFSSYALLAGLAPAAASGSVFLLDANGMLAAWLPPGTDEATIEARRRDVKVVAGLAHHHH